MFVFCLIFPFKVCTRDAAREDLARVGRGNCIHYVCALGRGRSIGNQLINRQGPSFTSIWNVHASYGILWNGQQQSYPKALTYRCKSLNKCFSWQRVCTPMNYSPLIQSCRMHILSIPVKQFGSFQLKHLNSQKWWN